MNRYRRENMDAIITSEFAVKVVNNNLIIQSGTEKLGMFAHIY